MLGDEDAAKRIHLVVRHGSERINVEVQAFVEYTPRPETFHPQSGC